LGYFFLVNGSDIPGRREYYFLIFEIYFWEKRKKKRVGDSC
jgi:hypothetical protein